MAEDKQTITILLEQFNHMCAELDELREYKKNSINMIKQKIDYLEELASIENNEGRWIEAEKYYYVSSTLEDILEYIKAKEIEDGDSN